MLNGQDFSCGHETKFVLVDMSNESARQFKDQLTKLYFQLPDDARLVILQAGFSIRYLPFL